MKLTICVALLLMLLSFSGSAQSLSLRYRAESPQERYAARLLENTIAKNKWNKAGNDGIIELGIKAGLGPEAFQIQKEANRLLVWGGDERGLIYGSFSVAEALDRGAAFHEIGERVERPYLPFRAIKYDLPWDSYRHSYALELHDQTCRDTAYWRAFLDMMAENRLNALTLWNLHPYTFLIKPVNFPEASPWTDAEMQEWKTLFHAITDMAWERAIDVYIIPFNIFVTPEFAKAHGVALDNLEHAYFVNGDTSAIIRRYTRECVTQLLEEYPHITGMGLTLGEGMGGMTPQQREDWMHETIITGMRMANRKSKLIHRIPFSSTTGSLGITSIETEKLTRRSIEDEASMGFTEGPIWADLKFNWSHAHSTTRLIKVHGGKLYDTYFQPEPTDYKIVWTARNEDFFCLRWGVPGFVREHILQNRHSWSGGYIIGSETYIPAKDYFTRDSTGLPWRYAFERQWLFYKIWGRLQYNPATADSFFQQAFTNRYGEAGNDLLTASSLAGASALRIAAGFDCGWDFTLYTEGMMARNPETETVEYISVDWLTKQAPLDTAILSIKEYVNKNIRKESPDKHKITPDQWADLLEKENREALEIVKKIPVTNNKALLYEIADIRAWAYLGLHFSEKIRGGIALQTYRENGGKKNKKQAILHLEKSLHYWDRLIAITRPLYKDMPLVHLSQQGGSENAENYFRTFHWEKLRSEVAKDITIAKKALPAVK